jgi:hypothetical protein
MDKYFYAVCKDGVNSITSTVGISPSDAKERIIRKYWDKYEDLQEDTWSEFVDELADLHDIVISKDVLLLEEI